MTETALRINTAVVDSLAGVIHAVLRSLRNAVKSPAVSSLFLPANFPTRPRVSARYI